MNSSQITLCDTSVLLNFINIDRLDLFEKSSFSFSFTDHVHQEITTHFPKQRKCLELALNKNIFQKITVIDSKEFEIFSLLIKSGQLGAGECAAIAVASHRGYFLAIDDNQAIKKVKTLMSSHRILRTQDLIVHMIEEQILDIDEADQLISIWANQHRFRLKIQSFRQLIPQMAEHKV